MLGSPLLLGDDGYTISRSVRLRSSASAYFSRTPGSASNRQTWTWSGWAKAGAISVARSLFSCGADGSNYTAIDWRADNRLQLFSSTAGSAVGSIVWDPMVFRDPTAWYHIVVTCDTTNATQTDRFRLYVNNVRYTTISSTPGENTWPAQNANTNVNNTVPHSLGRKQHNASEYFDGYMTDVHFIDGQALTPSAFGETDLITGVWKPKKYTGTYGTNGFFLNFSDPSAATAAAIGKDYSGNGNNFTPNNISVTAGTTYDSMLDVPTPWADGGNGRGNYAVLNQLQRGSYATIIDGNLYGRGTSSADAGSMYSSVAFTTGLWYAEFTVAAVNASFYPAIGIIRTALSTLGNNGAGGIAGYQTGDVSYLSSGLKLTGGSSTSYGASFAANDVISVAVDATNGAVYFAKNGVWQNSGVPTSGASKTGAAMTWTGGTVEYLFSLSGFFGSGVDSGAYANFGQRPFAYTPPSGFKALNTQNLPEPTIRKGNQYFDTSLYTGNAGSITVTNAGFQPDLVWIKARSSAFDHKLVDSARGASGGIYYDLQSNSTSAESLPGAGVNGLTSTGFTIGGGTNNGYNGNGTTFAAWQWKEGATPGFDIVTYTGNGTSVQNISHSLGVAPRFMIVKARVNTRSWQVYHASLGATTRLLLNTTDAQGASNSVYWNNTAPTSTQFTVGGDGNANAASEGYVAYLFSEVAGFSKFGSYTGNGSSDGVFVHLGFRARFLLVKQTSAAGQNWWIYDSVRDTFNVMGNILAPNTAGAETTGVADMDFLSNGFKIRGTGSYINASGATYIYAAFAENPFKYSLAR